MPQENFRVNFSTSSLAKLINCSTQTILNWADYYAIPIERDKNNKRIFTEEIVRIYKKIDAYLKSGLKSEEVKERINDDLEGKFYSQPRIEIIQEQPEQQQNFNLVIKPYTDRITVLEMTTNTLTEKVIELERNNATLTERVSNKDDIITILNQQKEELSRQKADIEAKLNNIGGMFGSSFIKMGILT